MKIKYKFFSPTVVSLTLILLVVILFVADLYATRQKSINSPKVGNQIIKLPLTKPKNTVKDDNDDDNNNNNTNNSSSSSSSNNNSSSSSSSSSSNNNSSSSSNNNNNNRNNNSRNNNNKSSCNLLSGRWVYDNTSEPEYKDTECSFMDEGMACEKFGRKNLDYKYWKWQPHDCDLPRFNALAMLEILRNKRLVYVGDSLNRNQWVSMVCLVESWIPQSLKYVHFNGSFVTFKAIAFNASIDFYWAPLLVESNCDNPTIHRVPERIVQVQAIEKHARHWHNADFIVFNSYIWWRWPKFKLLSDGVYQEVDMLAGYKMALKTLSDWLVIHVNRSKTKLFFVSSSPTHNRAEEWSLGANVNCYNETEPISKEAFWGIDSDPRMMRLVEAAIAELSQKGVKVQMLNITQISEYRKDAHSSIYRKQWDPLTQDQLANPSSYADCTHWCLPGVPDVWNQFLYTYLFQY